MDVQLSLLGGFGLAIAGKSLRFATRKESSLYAYLTLHQEKGPIRRERLAGLLWPDVEEQRARRNLSTALWRIKVILSKNDASLLSPQTTTDTVRVKLAHEAVDALKFQRLLEDSESIAERDRLQTLREAESLYTGDLLEEFEDEWCEEARRSLRGQYANVLRQLSTIYKNQGQYSSSAQFARKLVAVEPLDEEGHRELMLLYHLAGERHAALNQYESVRRILRLELGIEPNEATTQLWQYIRTTAPDADVIVRSTRRVPDQSTDSRIPLIGREQYVNVILDRIQSSLAGRGSALVISGEAGIGKTKLVETAATEAGLRDVQVLQGRCPDLQNPPPYQVILQALWPRVVAVTRSEQPGSLLGVIVKALSFDGNSTTKRTTRDPKPALNTTIVMEAILELFKTDSVGKPTLIILEDIHRIDQASLTLVATLLDRVASMPVVVLATIRPGERRSHEVMSVLTANGALHQAVPPLNESELHRLVRAILRDKAIANETLNFVWERTGGVPLFALEFVDFMVSGGHLFKTDAGIWAIRDQTSEVLNNFPSRVNEVIRKRIESLDQQPRKVLITAAVLGIEFSLEHLAALTGFTEDAVVNELDRLIDHRLIVELSGHFRFRHETIRAVALDVSAAEKRRILHLRAAAILEKVSNSQPEDLYFHFLEANKYEKALHYAEASGDKARNVHANANATIWYTKAVDLLSSTDTSSKDRLRKKIQLMIKRHEVLEVLGDPNRLRHIDSIQDLAMELKDKGLTAQIHYLRARVMARSKTPEEAIAPATTSCKLYREIKDLRGEAAATEILGEIYLYLRDHIRGRRKLVQAIRLFRQAGDQIGEARSIVTGSMVLLWEDTKETLASLERAESLLIGSEEFQIRARLLFQKGICYRLLGRARMADSSLRTGLELARRIGDRVSEARACSQLGVTLSTLGRHAEAIREARRGLRLARLTNDNRALITGLNNAAYCAYRLSGALKCAKAAAIEALHMVEGVRQNENPAMYKDTLAAILMEQGDYKSALKAALQARKLCSRGGSRFVKGDVYHHLGSIYLAAEGYDQAIPCLQKATRIFHANRDICNELLATASLILAFLEKGDLKLVTVQAKRLSKMMRAVEDVEQVQVILWSQYRASLAIGRLGEAQRALSKAYDAVLLQAESLKGRNRHRFLSDLRINRTILAEVARGSFGGNQITSITASRASTTAGSN